MGEYNRPGPTKYSSVSKARLYGRFEKYMEYSVLLSTTQYRVSVIRKPYGVHRPKYFPIGPEHPGHYTGLGASRAQCTTLYSILSNYSVLSTPYSILRMCYYCYVYGVLRTPSPLPLRRMSVNASKERYPVL